MSQKIKAFAGDPQTWIVFLLLSLVGINVPDLLTVSSASQDPALNEKLEKLRMFEKLEDQKKWKDEVIREVENSFSESLRSAIEPLTKEVTSIRAAMEKGERWSLEDMSKYHDAHLAGASPTPREIQIKRLGEEASRLNQKN